jgi:hypothetical protein
MQINFCFAANFKNVEQEKLECCYVSASHGPKNGSRNASVKQGPFAAEYSPIRRQTWRYGSNL